MSTVEERFAQKLASNDLSVRNRALKRLSKWIKARSALEDGFTEMELLKLWKGLHVCMWHSDKPLVQEELAVNIAKIIHIFEIKERALQFVLTFFTTISREWLGIDRLRLDKFYMLIRKVVHHCFKFLQEEKWSEELVKNFLRLMSESPLGQEACLGVQLHVLEVYLSELLSVVATSNCPGTDLLGPCFTLLANTTNTSIIECIEVNIIQPLDNQQVLQKLHVDCDSLSEKLRNLAINRNTVGKNRKRLYTLCKRFSDMNEEVMEDLPPPRKKAKRKKQSRQ